jgi:hypothetical protein
MGIWVFPEVKRPGHEVNHSPTSSPEVKNEWSLPLPPYMSSWHGQGKTLPLYLTFIVGIINICKKIVISTLTDE